MSPSSQNTKVDSILNISCLVWAEDALWRYGDPTSCIDLFVLVEDVEAAIQCLESAGYSRAPPTPNYKFIPELYKLPRLRKGDDERDNVAFLRAEQCSYSLPPANTIKDLIPPLPALIDSIIDAWLDASTEAYAAHLAVYLAYLTDYSPDARNPQLISQLKPGHRDFHLQSLTYLIRGSERESWKRVRDEYLLRT